MLHLGDQLDSVNGPRARLVEVQRLMEHLDVFLDATSSAALAMTDPFSVSLLLW